ncbi:MAG: hypothetical protein LUQ50_08725 [Methanospirillum sp.]|uniref:hypothetical protein n=1 Tax=Methanospirillum sp. TaxID=45200 RepID=UPI002369F6E5|nr:hypothetical protein [Methanospirillum sp.]MDD1729141.1 hypothetical protein [Methanospirillum sp.]
MSIHRFPHTNLYLWTAVIATVTIIFGLVSLGTGLGIESGLPVPADIPGGCILLLIGAILITGIIEGRKDRARWVQYGYTGLLLLLIFGVCTLLIAGAQAISLMIEGEFTDMGTLTGSGFIWGAILAIPAYPGIRRILFGCSQGGAF